jgi:hypothetical protein
MFLMPRTLHKIVVQDVIVGARNLRGGGKVLGTRQIIKWMALSKRQRVSCYFS